MCYQDWMFEILDAFDDIVCNAANVYRLQDKPARALSKSLGPKVHRIRQNLHLVDSPNPASQSSGRKNVMFSS